MRTQAIHPTETISFDKQMRLVLTFVGIAVAIVGSLTLLYGNHSISGMDFRPTISESSLSSVNTSAKLTAMNVVAAIWPF